MNENQNTFDLIDSILRVLGFIGFFTAVIFGFVIAGGNVITLCPSSRNFYCGRHYIFRPLMHPSLKISGLPA